jgi:hypothetical protein
LLSVENIPCDDNGTHFNNGRFKLKIGTFSYLSDPTVRATGSAVSNAYPTIGVLQPVMILKKPMPGWPQHSEQGRYTQYYIGSVISGESVAEAIS